MNTLTNIFVFLLPILVAGKKADTCINSVNNLLCFDWALYGSWTVIIQFSFGNATATLDVPDGFEEANSICYNVKPFEVCFDESPLMKIENVNNKWRTGNVLFNLENKSFINYFRPRSCYDYYIKLCFAYANETNNNNDLTSIEFNFLKGNLIPTTPSNYSNICVDSFKTNICFSEDPLRNSDSNTEWSLQTTPMRFKMITATKGRK